MRDLRPKTVSILTHYLIDGREDFVLVFRGPNRAKHEAQMHNRSQEKWYKLVWEKVDDEDTWIAKTMWRIYTLQEREITK